MEEELTFVIETIPIEGGRKLYNYEFFLDGEPVERGRPDESNPGPT